LQPPAHLGGIDGAPFYYISVLLREVVLELSPNLVIIYFGSNGDLPSAERYHQRVKAEVTAAPHIQNVDQLRAAMELTWNPPWLIDLYLALSDSRIFIALAEIVAGTREALAPNLSHSSGDEVALESDDDFAIRTVEEVVQACLSRGVKVLLIPEIHYQDLASNRGKPASEMSHAYYRIFQHLAKKYAQQGVHYASMLERFGAAPWMNYLADDMHMNDDGYRFLAEQIAEVIREKGLIREPPQSLSAEPPP